MTLSLIDEFRQVLAGLDEIDLGTPDTPVPWVDMQPGDNPLRGVVPDRLKRLFVAAVRVNQRLQRALNNALVRAQAEGQPENHPRYADLARDQNCLGLLYQQLDKLLGAELLQVNYDEIREQGASGEVGIFLRTGWQVVWRPAVHQARQPEFPTAQGELAPRFLN
ncbi:MAG: hypothetical protein KGI78_02250 [Patescibacteria group bacterium]|nr:hypothetical protein [Patescibacteria group bacterium]MDE1944521.1 hypothetical protein [Patescibacteria group bacterium]MDE1945368.1 hypothetical protein [Patescibacteria group bacterium]MDE2057655.1 hypothetical protein [Patescibacteria group bacterium]